MRQRHQEYRCTHCGALLAKRDAAGLCVRRGPLHAIVKGEFTLTLACYRCGTWNEHVSAKKQSASSTPVGS